MHPTVMQFVQRHVVEHAPSANVIELGSLDINGSARSLLQGNVFYWGIDRQNGPGVDEVCAIEEFPASPIWDLVICTEVLEHAPDQGAIVEKAFDLLAPGGHLILTAACDPRRPHSAIDENPIRDWEHYRNVDPVEMAGFLKRFEVCEIDVSVVGDFYVCACRPDEG